MKTTAIVVLYAMGVLAVGVGYKVLADDGAAPKTADAGEVCLSRALDVEGLDRAMCLTPQDIGGLLDRTVMAGGGEKPRAVRLTHPEQDDKSEQVTTCREYLALTDQGWFPLSGRDMSLAGYFTRNCTAIRLLAEAKPAARSAISESTHPLGGLQELPADMLTYLGPEGDAKALESSRPEFSLSQAIESNEVEVVDSPEGTLKIRYDGTEALYEEMARGDFDGDGVEDVLVFGAARMLDGTANWSFSMLLTRDKDGQGYRVVDVEQ